VFFPLFSGGGWNPKVTDEDDEIFGGADLPEHTKDQVKVRIK
jgi:hypothetical protein